MKSGTTAAAAVVLVLAAATCVCSAMNVTYDGRAIIIDGKRRVLVSGSVHYPRSTPDMWPELIAKSKEGGVDIIETYAFWNLHEPVRGKYDFNGTKDLVKFIQLVGEAGLYVHLRIGPYICAEWNYGGFPLWLHFIPDIKLRTDNEPFKAEMQRFTKVIVDLMKINKLYASQGGPIILSQVENEYGNVDKAYGEAGVSYIKWAAQMATSMDTGGPWVMCKQPNAPDPMIDTCNGFYCDQFTPNSPQKPKIWTEHWDGWFSSWGDPVPYRPAEDVAYGAAKFYQRNGTIVNYYMYHGGTNFGRSAGGPMLTTSYDFDAPIDEYGLLRQPKWGHLKDLHAAVKLCEEAMVASVAATTSLAVNVEATVYQSGEKCAAFLANNGDKQDEVVKYNGSIYHLPAWSVSILPDCQNVVYNTAQMNAQTQIPIFVPQTAAAPSNWSWFKEPVGLSSNITTETSGLVEQLNTTADKSDYLWYSLSMNITEGDALLQGESNHALHVDSNGHALHAFINGKLSGGGQGKTSNCKYKAEIPMDLKQGENTIDLLSMTAGLTNHGPFYDLVPTGITGVQIKGPRKVVDLSSSRWKNQVGLSGEEDTVSNGTSPRFASGDELPRSSPLTWYKATFNAPPGISPVAMDMISMGKGQAWINGEHIGRYWPAYTAGWERKCVDHCDYRGNYGQFKCLTNCGRASQQYYHVPRSLLKPTGNVLVLLEETGGDPTKITFNTREVGHICAAVSERHPLPIELQGFPNADPVLQLDCPNPDQKISKLHFVDFGTPLGACGSFSSGQCHSDNATAVVAEACIGKPRCTVQVSVANFGDPCADVIKTLAVEASCY